MKRFIRLIAAALLLTTTAAHAEFPERPITIVVPYAPGGAADALARVLASRMSARLGSSVVVDNRPGASGTIGVAYVARAAKDGYTLLYDATPFSINPALYSNLSYSDRSFQPLSLVSLAPNILIVRKDSPIRDLNDLIARARAKPGSLTFASGGSGTVQRLASELFRQGLGLDMLHVPYKSGGPAITDVTGGQVDFMFSTIAASYPLVTAGKLRALAISAPKRSKLLPEVPTVAEGAPLAGYEAFEWNGFLLPAGTPDAIVATLQKTIAEVLHEDDVVKRFADIGAQPIGSTPAEFSAFLKKEGTKWAEVVRRGDIKVD